MKVTVFTILSVLYIFSPPMSRAAGPPGDETAEQTELSVTYKSDAMAQKKFEWLSHTWLASVTLKLVGPWELGKIDAYRLYITFPPNQEEGGRVKALGFSFNDMAGITISVNDTQGYFIEDKDHACRLHYRGYNDEKWYEQQVETEDALRKQIVGMIAGEVVGRFDYPFQLYEAWKGGKTNTPVFEASTLNFKFDNSTGDHNEPSAEFSDDATYDFKRVTWQKLCYRGDKDRGYAAGFGHIVAYSFHMHRATDAVPFHIRVVLPYDVPAAGYESTMSKRYPVRYAELEWKISGSAAEFTETTFGGNKYRLYASPKMSWLDAKVDCQSRGGHLVTIDSKEENKAMADLLESAGEQNAWIGLGRDFGSWKWVDFTGMTTVDFRNWKTTPLGTHNYAEITLNGQWDSYEDAARKTACICEFEAAEPPSDMVTLTFVSAFDNDDTKDVSKYRVHMRLNGNLVYSGTPAVDHARLEGGNIVNFKGLEVKFDRAYLRAGRNLLKVSLSNVERKHWFAWDSIRIDGTPYEPSPQRWQLYSPTDVDGVYGGETYNFIFDAP